MPQISSPGRIRASGGERRGSGRGRSGSTTSAAATSASSPRPSPWSMGCTTGSALTSMGAKARQLTEIPNYWSLKKHYFITNSVMYLVLHLKDVNLQVLSIVFQKHDSFFRQRNEARLLGCQAVWLLGCLLIIQYRSGPKTFGDTQFLFHVTDIFSMFPVAVGAEPQVAHGCFSKIVLQSLREVCR